MILLWSGAKTRQSCTCRTMSTSSFSVYVASPEKKQNKNTAAMHSQQLISIIENWGKKDLAKTTPKKEKTRKREAIKQLAACHLELQRKGAANEKSRE